MIQASKNVKETKQDISNAINQLEINLQKGSKISIAEMKSLKNKLSTQAHLNREEILNFIEFENERIYNGVRDLMKKAAQDRQQKQTEVFEALDILRHKIAVESQKSNSETVEKILIGQEKIKKEMQISFNDVKQLMHTNNFMKSTITDDTQYIIDMDLEIEMDLSKIIEKFTMVDLSSGKLPDDYYYKLSKLEDDISNKASIEACRKLQAVMEKVLANDVEYFTRNELHMEYKMNNIFKSLDLVKNFMTTRLLASTEPTLPRVWDGEKFIRMHTSESFILWKYNFNTQYFKIYNLYDTARTMSFIQEFIILHKNGVDSEEVKRLLNLIEGDLVEKINLSYGKKIELDLKIKSTTTAVKCKCNNGTPKPYCSKAVWLACQACNDGYYLSDKTSTCELKVCKCDNGEGDKGKDCPANELHSCKSCDKGFYKDFTKNICRKNICRCDNGKAVNHLSCPKDGMYLCESCIDTHIKTTIKGPYKYEEKKCRWRDCNCQNGRAVDPIDCADPNKNPDSNDGFEACKMCYFGYSLALVGGSSKFKKCEKNICQCDNGYKFKDSRQCTIKNGQMCERCYAGYHLELREENDERICKLNECVCRNGRFHTGVNCSKHKDFSCKACNAGYHLEYIASSGKKYCAINVCKCEDGQPTKGISCPKHNSYICRSCPSGYYLTSTKKCIRISGCTSKYLEVLRGGHFLIDLCIMGLDTVFF